VIAHTLQNLDSAPAVLPILGRFDAQEVPHVQQKFDALLSAGARYIILDLHEVTFVDSSALALLVRGLKHCRDHSGELLLCSLRQPVSVLFELTRMDRAFRIFLDEASARRAVAPQ
jgi:anti-sigma B factor antagonist